MRKTLPLPLLTRGAGAGVYRRVLLALALAAAAGSTPLSAADVLPALHVEGNQLVDENGKTVVLHGVMDTPSPYFNGNRWGNHTGDDMTEKCIEYFDKLFTAMTDHSQGAYCTVFRLHLDPCWTNAAGASSGYWHYKNSAGEYVTGEADNSNFSESLFSKYIQSLYVPIIEKAISHGLYVVVRPPGVCPSDLDVNDASRLGTKKTYQQYLKQVWWMFAQNEYVQLHSGQISIELANEPVNITKDGKATDDAMTEYFQPIVNLLRTNSKTKGFTGIIWVPGTGWQSNYKGYSKYPVSDIYNNLGYAVHWYPGWYSSCSGTASTPNQSKVLSSFLSSVPVAKTSPVMITEVDWSPYNKEGESHTDEHGNVVYPNYGTWATSTTSSFGQEYKYVHDQLGNVSMTLSGTATYLDIDTYLRSYKVTPAFNALEEACGKACFDWYKEWYEAQTSTAVQGVRTDDGSVVQTTYYTLQGVQVDKPGKGVYIVKQLLNNGKTLVSKTFGEE